MPQYPYAPYNADLGAIVTLSAATANGNSALQTNGTARGAKIVIDITAMTGTSPTLTVTVEGYDSASQKYYTILASAALTTTGTTELSVYPGGPVTSNVAANSSLPLNWRVAYALGGTTPAVTATIGVQMLV
ncbi:MAG: hypothetical protein KGL39_47905 [Patescibacteria group bacterium]|nr:hypothetical protein [Patescibacteria group bacterium]